MLVPKIERKLPLLHQLVVGNYFAFLLGYLGPLRHLIVQCKLLCRASITIVAFVILMMSSSHLKESKDILNVLTRLHQHDLRVKAYKCCFAATKVLCLRHTVLAKGIHTDPTKIKAVFELSEQVRSFWALLVIIKSSFQILPLSLPP